MLDNYVSILARANRGLHLALRIGDLELLSQLLRAGAPTETWNDEGRTPIGVVVPRSDPKHQRALDILLAGGADPCGVQRDGRTAFEVALCHRDSQVESIAALLAYGARVPRTDHSCTRTAYPYLVAAGQRDRAVWYAAELRYQSAMTASTIASIPPHGLSAIAFDEELMDRMLCSAINKLNVKTLNFMKHRGAEICVALHNLHLPAFVTFTIFEHVFPLAHLMPMHKPWRLVTLVKHFHDKTNQK